MPEVKRTCILSHGRSGTVYTSMVLSSIGLDFGHEEDGKDGCIGGVFFKGHRDLDSYEQVFHQVRNPLLVISSSTTCKHGSFKRVFAEIGADNINESDPLRRSMISWLLYTEWAEEQSIWRYRIEDFEKIWPELLHRMNIDRTDLPNLPTNINTRLHKYYTWTELESKDTELANEVKKRARSFGYEV